MCVCVGQCASGAGHVSQLSAHTVGPQKRQAAQAELTVLNQLRICLIEIAFSFVSSYPIFAILISVIFWSAFSLPFVHSFNRWN